MLKNEENYIKKLFPVFLCCVTYFLVSFYLLHGTINYDEAIRLLYGLSFLFFGIHGIGWTRLSLQQRKNAKGFLLEVWGGKKSLLVYIRSLNPLEWLSVT